MPQREGVNPDLGGGEESKPNCAKCLEKATLAVLISLLGVFIGLHVTIMLFPRQSLHRLTWVSAVGQVLGML